MGTLLVWVVLGQADIRTVSAHAELLRSDPPSEGLLTVSPQRIDLWFSEPVDTDADAISLQIIDDSGTSVPVSNARIDAADPLHVMADVDDTLPGTFTVAWSVRSGTDGHTLSGTFGFRVGSGRSPGAATTVGETPRAWAVATRWTTFLGSGLAAAGFAFGLVITRVGEEDRRQIRNRRRLGAVAALAALVGTASEPFLQSRWPPAGTVAPSWRTAVATLPDAWWIRPAALLPALVLAVIAWRRPAYRSRLDSLGVVLSLAALTGLSLTSHSAAEPGRWHVPALTANVFHQWSVALWVGGLVHLALWWAAPRISRHSIDAVTDAPVKRFSRIAVPLVGIGLSTGVVNAGLILPSLASLRSSDYGTALLVKTGVLAIPLVLAFAHRRRLRRAVAPLWPKMHRTVRLEAALVPAVVLVASVLALLAPPVLTSKPNSISDVPKPALNAFQGQNLLVHFLFTPGTSGKNDLGIRLSNYDRTAYEGEQPARVQLRFVSLDTPVESGPVGLSTTGSGDWAVAGNEDLRFDGWWRVEATLRWLGQEDIVVPFYLLLPDPNLNGFDAPKTGSSDPAAAALYETGTATRSNLHTVVYQQSMSSDNGYVALSEHRVNDGSDGSVPGYTYEAVEGMSAVILGTTAWSRRPGEPWFVRESNPLVPPSEWDEEYTGATGFRLGRTEMVGDESAQVVTFVVPGDGKRVTAWYAWWIGGTSNQILREILISTSHYMTNDYLSFDEPLAIGPPADAPASPVP